MADPDYELYLGITERNKKALSKFVTKYAATLHVVILRLIDGYGDARTLQALFQATTRRIYTRVAEFDPYGDQAFKQWAHEQAREVGLDFLAGD